LLNPPQLSYRGVRLGKWIERLGHDDPEAQAAIREIGTNAIPQLFRFLTTRETQSSKELKLWLNQHASLNMTDKFALNRKLSACKGFEVLGDVASPAIPKLTELLNNRDTSRFAALALAAVGERALGDLTNGLRNRDPLIRRHAAMAFETLRTAPPTAIESLLEALSDEDYTVQWAAVRALGGLRREPTTVIPVLVEMLSGTNRFVRQGVVEVLGKWGPEAKGAAPALRALTGDPDNLIRNAAAIALRQIEPGYTNVSVR